MSIEKNWKVINDVPAIQAKVPIQTMTAQSEMRICVWRDEKTASAIGLFTFHWRPGGSLLRFIVTGSTREHACAARADRRKLRRLPQPEIEDRRRLAPVPELRQRRRQRGALGESVAESAHGPDASAGSPAPRSVGGGGVRQLAGRRVGSRRPSQSQSGAAHRPSAESY